MAKFKFISQQNYDNLLVVRRGERVSHARTINPKEPTLPLGGGGGVGDRFYWAVLADKHRAECKFKSDSAAGSQPNRYNNGNS